MNLAGFTCEAEQDLDIESACEKAKDFALDEYLQEYYPDGAKAIAKISACLAVSQHAIEMPEHNNKQESGHSETPRKRRRHRRHHEETQEN